ncbi:MAG: Mfa1 family fimbria major subunit [Tannerellaceae bacterium]|nr:Mfa1 family fimbria major subunit [Tannerellaceae bacterium]
MMKKKLLSFLCIGCVACAFTACSDDDRSEVIDPVDNGKVDRVEDALVSFSINQASPGSYAAGPNIDPATEAESVISKNVKVFIFDEDMIFEKSEDLSLTRQGTSNVWNSQSFMMSKGPKYFYVFANTPSAMADPGLGGLRSNFEKTILGTGSYAGYTAAAMSAANNFTMGTLQVKQDVVTGIDETTPQTISLEIGRLTAKVTLNNRETPAIELGEGIKGTFHFAEGEFRLLNESNNFYCIPQTSNGFNVAGSQTYSPYFDAYAASNYMVNPSWSSSNVKTVASSLYTLENTNNVPLNKSGTSVEIKYVYTPDESETYDVNNPTQNVQLSKGQSFWIGVNAAGEKIIFNDDPVANNVTGIVDSYEYVNGEVYYIVPIADKTETTASLKYAVLRNHSYRLTVNTISRLGNYEPGDIPDPELPIDDDALIDVEITVLPWFKIEQDVDL